MSVTDTVASETSHKLWWFANLLLFLCLPGTALIQKYLGLMGVAIYVIGVAAALLIMLRAQGAIYHFIEKRYAICVGLLVVGVVVVFAVVYPLETAGKFSKGNDRDEALNVSVISLVKGRYPYYEETPLANKVSALPGAILLSAPFVALGSSAYQNLFWLLVFLYITGLYLKDKVSAFMLLATALAFSTAVQYEFVSGGDVLANSIYVLVFLFLTIKIFANPQSSLWAKIAISVVFGISLASRPNFFMVLPLLFALLIRRANLKFAIVCVITVCLSASLIIAPFYLYDPKSFAPLRLGNKLARFDVLLPFVSSGIILVTIGLSIVLAIILIKRPENDLLPLFFWMSAITQLFPILCAIVLSTIARGYLDFGFLTERYGLFFLFFGVWGCWPYLFRTQKGFHTLPASSPLPI